ncbi:Mg2+ transporter protein, CorA-like/Zinc transport protein ZntB [Metarhizium album ARSEF 1941]|uniref:Mg2+ transporter protein, CorA-like/Zinc transport protein ZntB n=1 Tax=Metarhizium album (strain ARSEF 1941) TaxID=1081103 RepID=A0A0B2WU03_METAS|nr:Mg2+ transporter protein, CorA-like/Zinc transport protein ZntB [Metarhizium album ARSEF 1941]KHN97538.1 Mg2+ transporter protein, CorA-like/Zinc transport protein ZntB [Metarhizium album ARSEF 1941]
MAPDTHADKQEPSPDPSRPRTSSDSRVASSSVGLDAARLSPQGARARQRSARSDPEVYRDALSPVLFRRRSSRGSTFKTIGEGHDFDTYGSLPGWQPGSEPGYDPELPDGGHASMPTLSAECDITVVDFALERMVKRHFNNDGFIAFLEKPKEAWAKCRWINVNGLSWDVIQAVGNHKGLHKLALEDIMNLRNRTKADWYPNHACIIMTLQKLVHLVDDDDSVSSSSSTRSQSTLKRWLSCLGHNLSKHGEAEKDPEHHTHTPTRDANGGPILSDGSTLRQTSMIRSLQRYHASGNDARTEYMEQNSSLAPYHMAISAEQVSIFLTNDNTVISFFEVSADDVQRPIVTRLSTPGTSLRESCDASLLVQAIIDAIIDLALPLTAVYTDLLGDLELDVLTSPSIKQCRRLYICISEINKMLRFLNPIDNLVNVLRDHRTHMTQEQANRELENPSSGVVVTPMTHTYLGDVLDHCILITEAMGQLKQSSENLINLIFNTISANQSASMQQLTMVTIIFLPLTFITGFFGQNFAPDGFPEIHNGIWYFWVCAVPTAFATIVILMRDMIYAWVVRLVQRKQILSLRKKKQRRPRRG